MNEPVILFDGVCNLCNGAVDFILRHEATDELRFAALQSEVGARLAKGCGLGGGEMETLVLVEGERCYTQSAAALRIANHLKYPWRLLSILILVPRPWRDRIYAYIARRRYLWFGKRDTCRLPTAEEKSRFLE